MFQINNRSIRRCDFAITINVEYIWDIVLVFVFLLLTLNIMMDGILYFLNLNLFLGFRVGSRSPIFKSKLYVTTVNNNFLLLPIICHKEFHPRCFIRLKWNIVFMIIENSKRCPGTPTWSSATLGKHQKLILLDALKVKVFCIIFFAFKACVRYFLSNFYFFTKWYPFKNNKKYFLFRWKSSFCSQDIQIFSFLFHTFQIQKDKWKWNNLCCHELVCVNLWI